MTEWIKIPTAFHKDSEQLHRIIDAFVEFGISYRGQGNRMVGRHTDPMWEFWIQREDAANASRILAAILFPHEQEGAVPENCEGCGAPIGRAEKCPDRGLDRSWAPSADDPLIAFLREHLGDELPW